MVTGRWSIATLAAFGYLFGSALALIAAVVLDPPLSAAGDAAWGIPVALLVGALVFLFGFFFGRRMGAPPDQRAILFLGAASALVAYGAQMGFLWLVPRDLRHALGCVWPLVVFLTTLGVGVLAGLLSRRKWPAA